MPSALDPYRDIVEESIKIEREMFKAEKANKEKSWEEKMKQKLGLDDEGKEFNCRFSKCS